MGNFPETAEQRDLVLPSGYFAHMLDETKGVIKTHVGPIVVSQTGQVQPVRYNHSKREYQRCNLDQAKVHTIRALEGDYIVLENPSATNKPSEEAYRQRHPQPSTCENDADLDIGRKVNIPGPVDFALWPGQNSTVIPGHRLRRNDYLLARVYSEEAAKKNWEQAVIKAAAADTTADITIKAGVRGVHGADTTEDGASTQQGDTEDAVATKTAEELDLTTGKLLIIKGTEVSFYIPPTGVEVVPTSDGKYVRDAVTLEQLEFAILIDQNGIKRYERGPLVVFPEPTEDFLTENGNRKFKAIELNKISGIHVKVIAPWKDKSGKDHKEGDELFITGDDQAIFYPCPELSVIKYGDATIHYATAIPDAGSGRYVMNRETGVVKTQKGPQMLLPNPIQEVIVRRVLDDKQSELWYPGNQQALDYNRELQKVTGGGRQVSETDYMESLAPTSKRSRRGRGAVMRSAVCMAATADADAIDDVYNREEAGEGEFGDSFSRNLEYTKPRTITFDDKYDGVPRIGIWTSYAVMVVAKTGERRVETGPKTILLDYDETLEVLELSSGKPKNTDKLYRTVYLRITNNKVSDIINLETSDGIPVDVKLSMVVNFETNYDSLEFSNKWFDSENYVKLLCDHIRSVLKGRVRHEDIRAFHKNHVSLIRDSILGESVEDEAGGKYRPGMFFYENGMRVADVEVLDFTIRDGRIAEMLKTAQHEVITSNIQLEQAEKDLEVSKRQEQIKQEKATDQAATQGTKNKLAIQEVGQVLELAVSSSQADLTKEEERKLVVEAEQAIEDLEAESGLAREKERKDQEFEQKKADVELILQQSQEETEAVCKRFGVAQEGLVEALTVLGNQETLTRMAEALSANRIIGGDSLVDAIKKILGDSPLQEVADRVLSRSNNPAIPSASRE